MLLHCSTRRDCDCTTHNLNDTFQTHSFWNGGFWTWILHPCVACIIECFLEKTKCYIYMLTLLYSYCLQLCWYFHSSGTFMICSDQSIGLPFWLVKLPGGLFIVINGNTPVHRDTDKKSCQHILRFQQAWRNLQAAQLINRQEGEHWMLLAVQLLHRFARTLLACLGSIGRRGGSTSVLHYQKSRHLCVKTWSTSRVGKFDDRERRSAPLGNPQLLILQTNSASRHCKLCNEVLCEW